MNKKYQEAAKYLLRSEASDLQAYHAAARDERISLADLINRVMRLFLARKK